MDSYPHHTMESHHANTNLSNPTRMSSLELRGKFHVKQISYQHSGARMRRRLTNPNKAGHHRVISQNSTGDKKWAISEIYFTN